MKKEAAAKIVETEDLSEAAAVIAINRNCRYGIIPNDSGRFRIMFFDTQEVRASMAAYRANVPIPIGDFNHCLKELKDRVMTLRRAMKDTLNHEAV